MSSDKALKYFLYSRKSSEDSQRQVASIGDQIAHLSKVAENEGMNLVHPPFTEEKSAKDPGRPIFNEVLDRIEKGEANALLCWDIDRLYRNPVDEGRLRWLLQKGVIRVIRTPYRSFFPEDAGLLMGVEGGRATDYVIRLSKNVKRGLNSKALKGWRPSGGPVGYLNVGIEKGNKTIAPDPERFEVVRKIWDLFLSGTVSVATIHRIANEEWGLRTLQRRKIGGKPLALSHVYRILNDPFYYGYFPWIDPETGEQSLLKGSHQPMITEAEYWRAQELLGFKGKQRQRTREFAFTGLISCGECGSRITAEEKHQVICTGCKHKFAYEGKTACPKCLLSLVQMENPTLLHYTYYHCIKKSHRPCSQKGIRLEDLERQFEDVLKSVSIDPEYLELALDYLRDKQANVGNEETVRRKNLELAYENCQARLKNLHREYTSTQNSTYELYSPEEFKKLKSEVVGERDALEKQLAMIRDNMDNVLEATERTFNFCTFALHHFKNGDLKQKRAIFSAIGSNLTLKDKILSVERLHPFILIERELLEQRSLYPALEPTIRGLAKRKEAAFAASVPNWLRG